VPQTRPSFARRLLPRLVLGALSAVALVGVGAIADGWAAFGSRPRGARQERVERSPQWGPGGFENPQPVKGEFIRNIRGVLWPSAFVEPDSALPVDTGLAARLALPPASGLRVSWLGHSTLLIEIDGQRYLTDPVWSARTSPVQWAGPKRFYAPPLAIEAVGPLDGVLISHDHYDHLDIASIQALAAQGAHFYLPLGVGAHLEGWGVPLDHIHELDWWDEVERPGLAGALRLALTPARHASGRLNPQSNHTLWGGWALVGPTHRAFFSGDTGLFPALDEIGAKYGPFDVTMMESGAYNQAWPDWHMGPEQAVRAHQMVRGDVMIPIHWGLFNLAAHAWTEPAERVRLEAERRGVRLSVPKPGGSVEPAALGPLEVWWPAVPIRTAAEDPIISRGVDPEPAR
jgi:L-ascorbate metabolism protein UlaG (beta-lactamase superfamily)